LKLGRSTKRAKQFAAAPVNKERREMGETKSSSRKTSGTKKRTTGTKKRTSTR
jgi:hypothetical protein